MTLLDFIFLGALALGLVLGIWKGFIKQVFALAGVFVVAIGTTYLAPYPNNWLASVIESEATRSIVAIAITFVVLAIVYGVITGFIGKLVNKIPILGWLNRLLGAVFSVAVVYLIFSVIVSLFVGTSDEFLAGLKGLLQESFDTSWIVNNIYGGKANPERNFFGNWLLQEISEKISSLLPS